MKRALLTILALLPSIAIATINTIVVNKTGVTVSPGHTGNIATSQSTVVTATVNVPGPQGIQGAAGEGVPFGGTDGQVLTKKGLSNYSTHWQDPSSGASSWNDLTDKPDVAIKHQQATFTGITAIAPSMQIVFGNEAIWGMSYLHSDDGDNLFIGRESGQDCIATQQDYNCTGNYGLGVQAIRNLIYGSDNVAIGDGAGSVLVGAPFPNDAHDNVIIGFGANTFGPNEENTIVLGTEAISRGSNSTVIGNYRTTKSAIYGDHSAVITKGSIPASKTTYTSYTSSKTWANVQDAIDGTNRDIPSVCGLDPGRPPVYDGTPALSCAIDSGIAAFTYSALAADPLPAMLPYTVKLYEVGLNNNEPVTPDSIVWSVPTSNSLLFSTPMIALSK